MDLKYICLLLDITFLSGIIKNLYVIVSDTGIARYAALFLITFFNFGPMQHVCSELSSASKVGRPLVLFQRITASTSSRPLSAAQSDQALARLVVLSSFISGTRDGIMQRMAVVRVRVDG